VTSPEFTPSVARNVGNDKPVALVPDDMLASYASVIDEAPVMATKDTATLSEKFQISIPKAIRASQQWRAGQVFAFIPKGFGVMLVPVPTIDELSGLARGAKPVDYRDRTDRV
jgi:bifunctional DNA-binding transcriptional regulator/antitoxin component of YhaV-PrlF toxin-antitoxin module